jgi:hypothetical protein
MKKKVLGAQEVWMKNQGKKFWKDWACYIYLTILAICFLIVAWVEVPH